MTTKHELEQKVEQVKDEYEQAGLITVLTADSVESHPQRDLLVVDSDVKRMTENLQELVPDL